MSSEEKYPTRVVKSKTSTKLDEIRFKRSGYAAEVETNTENTLLLGNGQDDTVDKLRQMGLSHNIEHLLTKKATDIIEKKQQEDWNTEDFYHIDDIKEMCLEYNLRLLPSRLYGGFVHDQLINKVNELEKRNEKINFGENTSHLANQMFILAPVETFSLNNDYNTEYNVKPVNNSSLKVIVFYERDNGYYELIHEWGEDFSMWRKFVSWGISTKARHRITRTFNITAIVYFVFALIISFFGVLYKFGFTGHMILLTISFIIGNWIYCGSLFGTRSHHYKKDDYTVDKLFRKDYFRNRERYA